MKAIGKNILIEQEFIKKVSQIITLEGEPTDLEFNVTMTVIQMGAECPTEEINVNDIVYLNQYATPLRVEQQLKEETKIVNHAIYEYSAIVGKE